MPLASRVGRDRADVGAPLTVVTDGSRLSSEVRRSSERQVAITVPRTRDARRIRRALGSVLTVCWRDLGEVRSRVYNLVDVTGGTDPQWILVPAAEAQAGNRRMVPRAAFVTPFGVRGPTGLVVGTTVDVSSSGARIRFPAHRRGTQLLPLPQEGDHIGGVMLVEGVRLEVTVDVVRALTVEGCRELRLAFTDLDHTARSVLQAALGKLDEVPGDSAPAHGMSAGVESAGERRPIDGCPPDLQ